MSEDEYRLPPWAKSALITMRKRWHRVVVVSFDSSAGSRTLHVRVQRDNEKSPWHDRRVWNERGVAMHHGYDEKGSKGPTLKMSELNRSDDQLRSDKLPMRKTSARRMTQARERNKGNMQIERPLKVQSLLVERTEIIELLRPLDFSFVRNPTRELLDEIRALRDRLDDVDSILVDLHEETEETRQQQDIIAMLEAMSPAAA